MCVITRSCYAAGATNQRDVVRDRLLLVLHSDNPDNNYTIATVITVMFKARTSKYVEIQGSLGV